jgi:hypothetical protein
MFLGPEDGAEPELDEIRLHSREYSSKRAHREALIEQQRDRLTRQLGPTIHQLEELCLRPRGAATSKTVVVEGPARQILRSLELSGVRHASLDRKVDLIRPNGSQQEAG